MLDRDDVKQALTKLVKACGGKIKLVEQCSSHYQWSGSTAKGTFIGGRVFNVDDTSVLPEQVLACCDEQIGHCTNARRRADVADLSEFRQLVQDNAGTLDVTDEDV